MGHHDSSAKPNRSPSSQTGPAGFSPYLEFTAEEWGRLRAATPLDLSQTDLDRLRGINVELSLDEVVEIFLPLSRLLNLYVRASQELYRASDTFLGQLPGKVPYIIGVAGSVAVGKSTTARVLQALLDRWPNHPKVDLITTDGFLHPNKVLAERGLMDRKGFPESYDRASLLDFISNIKSGAPRVEAPVYSHLSYDVLPDEKVVVCQPDIVIVEGLNVLQTISTQPLPPKSAAPCTQSLSPSSDTAPAPNTSNGSDHNNQTVGAQSLFVSDFFDFSIYVDADIDNIRRWYVERFFTLRKTAFANPDAYFHHYSKLTDEETKATAIGIWTAINERNLMANILPTRERADLILSKGSDHQVDKVRLRRL